VKYDFISSLEASNIKSYEVAVAMKYAAHMFLEFILLHIAVKTAILHNSQNYFKPALQVLHFLPTVFGGIFFFTTFLPQNPQSHQPHKSNSLLCGVKVYIVG